MRNLFQRSSALALLLWINFLLVFAVLSPATSAASNLPACCRRAGQHGCSMVHPANSGPVFQVAPCAQYPRTGVAPVQLNPNGVAAFVRVVVPVVSHPTPQPQTETRYRASYNRSEQERGPPLILA